MDVNPSTIVAYSDIGCPWSHAAVHRMHETRRRLGLEQKVAFDMRAFPLEIVNARPTPKLILDAEIPVAEKLAPDAGWQMWQEPEHTYPVTMLLALEAVQAAKEQGLEASARLDRALRVAFFGESQNVSMRHVILDVAKKTDGVDAAALEGALDDGRARRALMDQVKVAQSDEVKGSPHLFLPDGSDVHNPGVEIEWSSDQGEGFPRVTEDDPTVYEELLRRAAG